MAKSELPKDKFDIKLDYKNEKIYLYMKFYCDIVGVCKRKVKREYCII